jgi:hypothetical protein
MRRLATGRMPVSVAFRNQRTEAARLSGKRSRLRGRDGPSGCRLMRLRKDKRILPYDRLITKRANTLLHPLVNLGCARAKPIGRQAVDTLSRRLERAYLNTLDQLTGCDDNARRPCRGLHHLMAASKIQFSPLRSSHRRSSADYPIESKEILFFWTSCCTLSGN